MSRIGNKPIPLPQGVKIALKGREVEVQGPKASSTWACRTASLSSKKMACCWPSAPPKTIARCTDWPVRWSPTRFKALRKASKGFGHRGRRLPR